MSENSDNWKTNQQFNYIIEVNYNKTACRSFLIVAKTIYLL